MPLRHRLARLLLVSLCVATLLWLRAGDSNQAYDNLQALSESQQTLGFVSIGRFGDAWPARVVEIRDDDNRIDFLTADGQRHQYDGFDGYRLRLIRLTGEKGGEVVVIFRSAEPGIKGTAPQENGDAKPLVRRL